MNHEGTKPRRKKRTQHSSSSCLRAFVVKSVLLPAIRRRRAKLLLRLGHRLLVILPRLLPRVRAQRHVAGALAFAAILARVLATTALALAVVLALARVLLCARAMPRASTIVLLVSIGPLARVQPATDVRLLQQRALLIRSRRDVRDANQ